MKFDPRSGRFSPLSPFTLKVCALSLLFFNSWYLHATYVKIASDQQSGDSLVKILSDIAYNCYVATTVFFILECTEKLASVFNQVADLQMRVNVPRWAPAFYACFQIVLGISNFACYYTKNAIAMAFMASTADVFLASLSGLHIFIHHVIWECFRQINEKVKEAEMTQDAIFQLRRLHGCICAVCDDVQDIFGFVTLIIIADRCLYVQIDVYYFASISYNWVVAGFHTEKHILINFVIFTSWAAMDYFVIHLMVIVCSKVEQEVRNSLRKSFILF